MSSLPKAHKKIRVREQCLDEAIQIEKKFKLSPVAARVVAARGYRADKELEDFLNPTLRSGLPDPSELKNLQAACDLIQQSVEAGDKVAICCDFDVDGLSGGAQLLSFLQEIKVEAKVFVPDRFKDGYGLNTEAIETIAAEGFGLLVTIDFGTTNIKEIQLAKELRLKTIIIDHHHVGDHIPDADVFINHHQEGCNFAGKVMCAAGLVWYLLIALRKSMPAAKDVDVKEYLDLACLGTICDMVPLRGVNRVIAKRGLDMLEKTKRPGLIAMKNNIGINDVALSAYNVSFGIGPRLNAAGRLVHGELVIELLTTKDSKRAGKLADKLEKLNQQRRSIENKIKERAVRYCERECEGAVPAGLVVWDDAFHTGVIGIVAQRLVEDFYRPSAVMGMDVEGIFKGSVRGIKGISVVEILEECSEHLLKFGGHEGAGGFSVEQDKVELFAESFRAACEKRLQAVETEPSATADTEVEFSELSLDLVNELRAFSPFGVGNPGPQLMLKDVKVADVQVLKNEHLKARLTDGSRILSGLMWRVNKHPHLSSGARVDLIFKPEINTFNGNTNVQANMQAIEKA